MKETEVSGAEAAVERKRGRTYEGLNINDAEGVLLITLPVSVSKAWEASHTWTCLDKLLILEEMHPLRVQKCLLE